MLTLVVCFEFRALNGSRNVTASDPIRRISEDSPAAYSQLSERSDTLHLFAPPTSIDPQSYLSIFSFLENW